MVCLLIFSFAKHPKHSGLCHFCSSHFCEAAVFTGFYWIVLLISAVLTYLWSDASHLLMGSLLLGINWLSARVPVGDWAWFYGSWVPRVQPKNQALAKSLLAFILELFYWPKLVIGWSSESMWKKTSQGKRFNGVICIFFVSVIEEILFLLLAKGIKVVVYQRENGASQRKKKNNLKNERFFTPQMFQENLRNSYLSSEHG